MLSLDSKLKLTLFNKKERNVKPRGRMRAKEGAEYIEEKPADIERETAPGERSCRQQIFS